MKTFVDFKNLVFSGVRAFLRIRVGKGDAAGKHGSQGFTFNLDAVETGIYFQASGFPEDCGIFYQVAVFFFDKDLSSDLFAVGLKLEVSYLPNLKFAIDNRGGNRK